MNGRRIAQRAKAILSSTPVVSSIIALFKLALCSICCCCCREIPAEDNYIHFTDDEFDALQMELPQVKPRKNYVPPPFTQMQMEEEQPEREPNKSPSLQNSLQNLSSSSKFGNNSLYYSAIGSLDNSIIQTNHFILNSQSVSSSGGSVNSGSDSVYYDAPSF